MNKTEISCLNAMKATFASILTSLFISFTFLFSVYRSGEVFFKLIEWIGILNITVFLSSLLLFTYILGKKAGLIIKSRYFTTSYLLGIAVVLLSTLLTSFVAFVATLLSTALPEDWLLLFIFKPIIWMLALSLIPIIIAGSWYGYQLKRQS